MKNLIKWLCAVIIIILAGCQHTEDQVSLTENELNTLRTKQDIVMSDSLKQKLIDNGGRLQLTPEELQVLETTGKIILCGKCGHILNSLKYKQFKNSPEKQKNIDQKTGFAQDSIRHRLLGPYTD